MIKLCGYVLISDEMENYVSETNTESIVKLQFTRIKNTDKIILLVENSDYFFIFYLFILEKSECCINILEGRDR